MLFQLCQPPDCPCRPRQCCCSPREAELCQVPWPYWKEKVFFLASCSVAGDASSCSRVVWAPWCYTLVILLFQFYLFFSPGLAYDTEIIGPGCLQITETLCWTQSHYSFWSLSPFAKSGLLCGIFLPLRISFLPGTVQLLQFNIWYIFSFQIPFRQFARGLSSNSLSRRFLKILVNQDNWGLGCAVCPVPPTGHI